MLLVLLFLLRRRLQPAMKTATGEAHRSYYKECTKHHPSCAVATMNAMASGLTILIQALPNILSLGSCFGKPIPNLCTKPRKKRNSSDDRVHLLAGISLIFEVFLIF